MASVVSIRPAIKARFCRAVRVTFGIHVRFIQALFDGKLISQENVNQMKNGMGVSDLKLGDKTFYGNGGS
ncbi:MAG TPA: hypothetical protein VFZ23_14235, partial [Pyrinomonadaceae bacterium]